MSPLLDGRVSGANAVLGGGRGWPEGPGAHCRDSVMFKRVAVYKELSTAFLGTGFQIHLYSRFRFMRRILLKTKAEFADM